MSIEPSHNELLEISEKNGRSERTEKFRIGIKPRKTLIQAVKNIN